MKHLDLFSGIGGFALAARWIGWQTIGFVEIDSFCQKVLRKHWPEVQIEGDIRQVTGRTFRERPDIITGGFPCQPFSVAGKRRGAADDRHLWPEMVRVIKEYKPTWVLGENVAGIIPMELDSVLLDLEVAGYEAWPLVIPACGVDAKHRRARVWIVGYSKRIGSERWRESGELVGKTRASQANGKQWERVWDAVDAASEDVAHANGTRQLQPDRCISQERRRVSDGGEDAAHTASGFRSQPETWNRRGMFTGTSTIGGKPRQWATEPNVGRVANGVSRRVDRLRSLGNSIVPQVAYEIFRAIHLFGVAA